MVMFKGYQGESTRRETLVMFSWTYTTSINLHLRKIYIPVICFNVISNNYDLFHKLKYNIIVWKIALDNN